MNPYIVRPPRALDGARQLRSDRSQRQQSRAIGGDRTYEMFHGGGRVGVPLGRAERGARVCGGLHGAVDVACRESFGERRDSGSGRPAQRLHDVPVGDLVHRLGFVITPHVPRSPTAQRIPEIE